MNHTMIQYRILIFAALMCAYACAERKIVDEIRTVVCGEDGARIILTSESIRPDLDGRPTNLKDTICEELLLSEAQRYHIIVTPDDVEHYIAELQKNNHMSRAGLEHAMEEMGYTYQEGMEKLRRRQVTEQVIDNRVRGDKRFVITEEEVNKFNTDHPIFDEAVYTLADVVLDDEPSPAMSQEELDTLPWEEPFEVKERDLAEDMQFIATIKVGDIVSRDHVDGVWELTRLIGKKPRRRVGLDEVVDQRSGRTLYDKIVDVIRMQRYETLIEEYHAELLSNATLRFTYEQDRLAILGPQKL